MKCKIGDSLTVPNFIFSLQETDIKDSRSLFAVNGAQGDANPNEILDLAAGSQQ